MKMIPPIILIADDGPNIYDTLPETLCSVEALDLRDGPFWMVFDSRGWRMSLRPVKVRKSLNKLIPVPIQVELVEADPESATFLPDELKVRLIDFLTDVGAAPLSSETLSLGELIDITRKAWERKT